MFNQAPQGDSKVALLHLRTSASPDSPRLTQEMTFHLKEQWPRTTCLCTVTLVTSCSFPESWFLRVFLKEEGVVIPTS